ncbi:leucine-rich repeat extensin-like protein 5 [Homalodisca vitripennis]|uniref:leucine-rich repeat extensin-like protein 5 n=1 Tax=Homalodisca vitripennis TaxID=197043 RepID=UPI001EEC2EB5|nr:leucine-rich repeat extensin-like protein 5 [Homalodisca vitripennis]
MNAPYPHPCAPLPTIFSSSSLLHVTNPPLSSCPVQTLYIPDHPLSGTPLPSPFDTRLTVRLPRKPCFPPPLPPSPPPNYPIHPPSCYYFALPLTHPPTPLNTCTPSPNRSTPNTSHFSHLVYPPFPAPPHLPPTSSSTPLLNPSPHPPLPRFFHPSLFRLLPPPPSTTRLTTTSHPSN